MKSAKSKRQFTLLTLVVALGVAVYLNWEYAKTDAPFALQDPGAVSANAAVETVTDGTTSGVLDALPVQEALPDKNYGDAQLVSANETSNDKYFEQARLTRSKTRDEALDTMQQALKNAELSETEKTAVTQTLTNTINSITVESDIENMVKAKGFADCVAFIEGEKINLAVKTGSEGLDKSEGSGQGGFEMDVTNSSTIGGSLQISTDVIAKIAKLATLEIEGVKEVSTGTMGVKSLFNKVNLQKPILVQLTDDVAEITVNIMVKYGYKIPQLCEKVQENVKSSVQNMTCITVSKVNIVVTGVAQETAGPEAE